MLVRRVERRHIIFVRHLYLYIVVHLDTTTADHLLACGLRSLILAQSLRARSRVHGHDLGHSVQQHLVIPKKAITRFEVVCSKDILDLNLQQFCYLQSQKHLE